MFVEDLHTEHALKLFERSLQLGGSVGLERLHFISVARDVEGDAMAFSTEDRLKAFSKATEPLKAQSA